MTQVTTSGTELHLRPEEELVPYDHWLSWLKNLALECTRKAHIALHANVMKLRDLSRPLF